MSRNFFVDIIRPRSTRGYSSARPARILVHFLIRELSSHRPAGDIAAYEMRRGSYGGRGIEGSGRCGGVEWRRETCGSSGAGYKPASLDSP